MYVPVWGKSLPMPVADEKCAGSRVLGPLVQGSSRLASQSLRLSLTVGPADS